MKKNILFLFCIALLISCSQSEKEQTEEQTNDGQAANNDSKKKEDQASVPELKIPDGFVEIMRTSGDLDNDGTDELVIVFENGISTAWGPERELDIYKLNNNTWELWNKSVGAIMSEEEGGMMGDPFMNLYIERGCIVVEHFGGSREKWGYTHRFRFQNNEWDLIGTTANYGAPCEGWENYDYNLSTGKINIHKTKENCEDVNNDTEVIEETTDDYSYEYKLDTLPSLGNFRIAQQSIPLPEGKDGAFYY